MDTYKNIEIHRDFKVSNTTVGRWIEAAIAGRNNLQLEEVKPGTFQIIRNEHNNAEMMKLKKSGVKKKNARTFQAVSASQDFYKNYAEIEVLEIMNSLEIRREINFKFSYKGDGGRLWDWYYQNSLNSEGSNAPKMDKELLNLDYEYVKYLTQGFKIVNLIDVGPGNSEPLKDFIGRLAKDSNLEKYVGIDISPEVLEISRQNIASWFPKMEYHKYVADIENINFIKMFAESRQTFADYEINLIVFIGHTLCNHDDRRKVVKNLRMAMGTNDFLIISSSVDDVQSRADFEYMDKINHETSQGAMVLRMLGIDVSKCPLLFRYDQKSNSRVVNMKLDKDYEVKFKVLGREKTIHLFKSDEITIYRHYLTALQELLYDIEGCGLQVKHVSTNSDHTNAMVICKSVIDRWGVT